MVFRASTSCVDSENERSAQYFIAPRSKRGFVAFMVLAVTAAERQAGIVEIARPLGLRKPQHRIVEQRVARPHREAAATEGDDLARCGLHNEMFVTEAAAVLIQRS